MFSRRLYLKIICHILLILATAGAGGVCILSGQALIIGCLLLGTVLFQIQHLVNLLNRNNKRIALFLDTLQDGEYQHFFPEVQTTPEELRLNATFNKINALFEKIQRENQRQEHFYKALLEHAPSGILSWDTRGRILFINRTALQLLGLRTLIQIEELLELHPGLSALLASASPHRTHNIQLQTHQETRHLALVKSNMQLQGQTVTLLSLQDIREPLNERENESWQRLTHVLTHEIMNSIAPVTSLSETLSSYFEKDGQLRNREEITDQILRKTVKGLAIVKRQGKSLLHFAESYRKLSFLPDPVRQTFELQEFIENIIVLFQSVLNQKNIELDVQIIPHDLIVNADENLLSQVIVNLLKNAIEALADHPRGKITLSAFHSQQTTIEISDNGPGIPIHLQKDIFTPFFTTKASGSGIGLSLSQQILRKHGGDLLVYSSSTQGSRFVLTLPDCPLLNCQQS